MTKFFLTAKEVSEKTENSEQRTSKIRCRSIMRLIRNASELGSRSVDINSVCAKLTNDEYNFFKKLGYRIDTQTHMSALDCFKIYGPYIHWEK